jgi:hypothetical protein
MIQIAHAPTTQNDRTSGLHDLVAPRWETTQRDSALDSLHAGLHSIIVQWAHGKSAFGWLRSVGAQHVEIRVRDGSDEEDRALIFSIVPLPKGRITQEFRVSTEGRGLMGHIQAPDNRILPFLRGPREMWSWNDLRDFIEQQAALLWQEGPQRPSSRPSA